MKTIIILIITLACITPFTYAQNDNLVVDGNVSVGTTYNNFGKLEVSSTNQTSAIYGTVGTAVSVYSYGVRGLSYNQTTQAHGVYGFGHGGSSANGIGGYFSCYGSESTGLYYGIFAGSSTFGNGTIYAGYFSGDVYTSGVYLPSHSSLKKEIKLKDSSLKKLLLLEVKEYEYRNNEEEYFYMNLPKGKQTGFVAEELKVLYPELVKQTTQPKASEDEVKATGISSTADITFEAVNYVGLIPHLVKAIQEQQQIINGLNERIDEMEVVIKK